MPAQRLLAYTHLHRTGNPTTGVGKHIIHMIRGLAAEPELKLALAAPRDLLNADGAVPESSLLKGMPAVRLPWKRSWLERSSKVLGWPSIDRWIGDVDCVYSPAEVYLRTRSRLIVTVHDVVALETDLPWSNEPVFQRNCRYWRLLFSRLQKSGAELATVSEFSRRRIVELTGFSEKRVFVVGNGVEERYFDTAHLPRDAATPGPYALVIGLIARKGASYILELAKHLKTTQIVCIGQVEPVYTPALRELKNVTHLDAVPDERLPGLMQNAVALLQLSRYEGFGIPVAEAMAIGTPAIVSSWASLREIAGPAGIVFDLEKPNAIPAIADRITQLESNSADRAQIIARGRAWAQRFHWSQCVERLKNAILRR